MAPVTRPASKGDTVISIDEGPGPVKLDRSPAQSLICSNGPRRRPLYQHLGRRGARPDAREHRRVRRALRQMARIVAHASTQAPEWFTTAPVGAIQKVLARAGWQGAMWTCGR